MKKLFYVLFFALISLQLSAAPRQWFAHKFPPQLINAKGKTVDTAAVLSGKMVAVYFSASWCGPCRSFTPQLVKFYRDVKKLGNFELVFISSDKTANDMMKYMKSDKMPWLAVPFKHPAAMALKQELHVNGIPTLVVYDSRGKLISKDARWDVTMLGNKAIKAWQSPEYKPMTYDDWKNNSVKDKKSVQRNKKKNKNKKKNR